MADALHVVLDKGADLARGLRRRVGLQVRLRGGITALLGQPAHLRCFAKVHQLERLRTRSGVGRAQLLQLGQQGLMLGVGDGLHDELFEPIHLLAGLGDALQYVSKIFWS